MRRLAAIFIIIVAVFAVGCQKKPVAVVNGEKITEQMLQRYLKLRVSEHKSQGLNVDNSALRNSVLQQLISERLLIQGAREQDITVSDDELQAALDFQRARRGEKAFDESLKTSGTTLADYKENLRESLIVDKFVSSLVSEDTVTAADAKKYYQESPTPFLRPEEANIAFIQVATEDEGRAIMDEIKKEKGNFDKVSDRVDKEQRGLVSAYGWTSPSVFSPEIAEAIRSVRKGGYSGPHRGGEGYYIIRVKDRRPEGVRSFEEAKDEIMDMLVAQKRQTAVIHWVANKRKTSDIVIN